jgi:hypothetical protein
VGRRRRGQGETALPAIATGRLTGLAIAVAAAIETPLRRNSGTVKTLPPMPRKAATAPIPIPIPPRVEAVVLSGFSDTSSPEPPRKPFRTTLSTSVIAM